MSKIVSFEEKTIGDLYKQIGNFYIQKNEIIQMACRIIDVNTIDFPKEINHELNSIYCEYVNKGIDSRWKKGNGDWYLSFSRRIYETRNKINQFQEALECLAQDKGSRRCIICANDITDSSKYRPALVSIMFMIRDNCLDMHTYWRAEELLYAFPMNTLSMLSYFRIFFKELKKIYPDIKMGNYLQFTSEAYVYRGAYPIIRWGMWNNLQSIEKGALLFFWSTIFEKEEERYDANYSRQW